MMKKLKSKNDVLVFQLRFQLYAVAGTQQLFLSENGSSKLSAVSKYHIFRDNNIHSGKEDGGGGGGGAGMLNSYSPPPFQTTSILLCPLGKKQTNEPSICQYVSVVMWSILEVQTCVWI